MPIYQVDGLSGTGKTTLAIELQKRGYNAIDADEEFGYFGNPETGEPTKEHIQDNWLWNTEKIRIMAASIGEEIVFICGGAMNQNEIMDIFDIRFTLYVDDDTLTKRLLGRTNNDFGKKPEQLARQIEWNKGTIEYAKSIGSIPIDATQPIDKVADEILLKIKS